MNPIKSIVLPVTRGIISIALRGAEGITDLSARVHLQFSHLPWLGGTEVESDIQYAPLPYRIVYFVFRTLRKIIEPAAADDAELQNISSDDLKRLISIVNGVIGDRLEEWKNPLAIQPGFQTRTGQEIINSDVEWDDIEGVIVFTHGLCMNPLEWESKTFNQFIEKYENAGYLPLMYRYNSGRSIPINGFILHEQLEELSNKLPESSSIDLVGHSMGGLLSVSASAQGAKENAEWLSRLNHLVSIAGPFQGAPLERIGHFANSLLGILPFTKPFMDLGRIRGTSIRQLRDGTYLPDDFRESMDKQGDVTVDADLLLIGSSLNDVADATPLGDGMVPADSALARDTGFLDRLFNDRVSRLHLNEKGHIQILQDRDTFESIDSFIIS